jgi:hypothetical protein
MTKSWSLNHTLLCFLLAAVCLSVLSVCCVASVCLSVLSVCCVGPKWSVLLLSVLCDTRSLVDKLEESNNRLEPDKLSKLNKLSGLGKLSELHKLGEFKTFKQLGKREEAIKGLD